MTRLSEGVSERVLARRADRGPDGEAVAQFVELLPCLGFIEADGLITVQNQVAAATTGLEPTQPVAVERIFLGAFPPAGGSSAAFDCLLIRQRGQPLSVHGSARVLDDGRRLIVAMERRREGDGEGTFLGDLLDSAPEAMAIVHEGRVLHVNREFERLFGYAVAECIGQEIDVLLVPEGRLHENEILQQMMGSDGRGSLETVRHARGGEAVDVSLLVAPVRLSGSTMGLFYTFRDIRQQKEQEARLHHTAMHDALTGLANRALFYDRLHLTMARLQRRPDRHFAVLFLDLDRFKHVNDTLGHGAGDALLLEVTRRLRESVRPQDTVSRFGGDEFAVLLDEVTERDDVAHVAERIQRAVRLPVLFGETPMLISASIGIAMVTPAYRSAEEVVRDADLAMYQAKSDGKGRHAFAPAPLMP